MRNSTKGLAKLILTTLAKGALVITISGLAGYAGPKIFAQFARGQAWSIKRELRRLHKLRKIELKEYHDGRIYAKLTAEGEKAVLRDRVLQCKISPMPSWDGKWRVLIFDIPEIKKTSRDLIRQCLRRMGFKSIQKSVFVCPYKCNEEVKLLQDFFEVNEKYMYVFIAESLGKTENSMRHVFELS